MKKPLNVDEYIESFPIDVQKNLRQLRAIVVKTAPDAEEVISYSMPAYKFNGMLLYFAAFKNHIGFYPMASGISEFQTEIENYKWARGSVQFPLNKPLPISLITKIIKFRVKENLNKAAAKKYKK